MTGLNRPHDGAGTGGTHTRGTHTTIVAQRSAATEPQEDRSVFSIVAPVYNEEETLPHFYVRVVAVMEHVGKPFELV